MILRPPRSTQSRSSAASDVYKRQTPSPTLSAFTCGPTAVTTPAPSCPGMKAVSYTHLRAHETRHDLVGRLLLEKKKKNKKVNYKIIMNIREYKYNINALNII